MSSFEQCYWKKFVTSVSKVISTSHCSQNLMFKKIHRWRKSLESPWMTLAEAGETEMPSWPSATASSQASRFKLRLILVSWPEKYHCTRYRWTWQDYLLNIWPLTTSTISWIGQNFSQVSWTFRQVLNKLTKKFQRILNFA